MALFRPPLAVEKRMWVNMLEVGLNMVGSVDNTLQNFE